MDRDIYSDIIKYFWEEHFQKHFSQCERDFFFYLIGVWNEQGCILPFACSSNQTERDLSMPRKTIIQCRKRLSDRGVIRFKEGERRSKNPYYFFPMVTKEVTKVVTKEVTKKRDSVKVPPTPPSKDNINNNKETSSDEDVKKDKLSSHTSSDRMDWKAFEETFNRMMPPDIPRIKGIKEDRRRRVKARIEEYSKESVMEVFNKIIESDFLSGRNRKSSDTWKCNFDFIFSKDGFRKILEGNYDNGAHQTHYSEKRAANEEVFRQFIAEREQRASGMVVEVEKPF